MLVASAMAACDAGKQHDQQTAGPKVTIVGVNVGTDKPMPVDGVVQLAFDRYLLPSSVTRQSIVLVEANNEALTTDKTPIIVYDPVARTVTLGRPDASRPWLTPGQTYKVLLALGGLKAIDGAGLANKQDLAKPFTKDIFVIEFMVDGQATTPAGDAGAQADAGGGGPNDKDEGITADLPQVSFCRDVYPIFFLKCGGPQCHGSGATAAASLVLDSDVGIAKTAINRVAQGSNVGPVAGTPPSESRRLFGADMPIISVNPTRGTGSPGNSWLMYKIDLAPPPLATGPRPTLECTVPTPTGQTPSYRPLAYQPRTYADDLERSILDDFILGKEMPYPIPQGSADYTSSALTFDEREIIRIWIARGASVANCGGCRVAEPVDASAPPSDAATPVPTPDAATPDAAPADAGDAGDAGADADAQ